MGSNHRRVSEDDSIKINLLVLLHKRKPVDFDTNPKVGTLENRIKVGDTCSKHTLFDCYFVKILLIHSQLKCYEKTFMHEIYLLNVFK